MGLQLYTRSLRIWRGIWQQFALLRNGINMILYIPLYTGGLDSLKWFNSLLEKRRCIQLLKWPQILLLQGKHLIHITHELTAPTSTCSASQHTVQKQSSAGHSEYRPSSVLLAKKAGEKHDKGFSMRYEAADHAFACHFHGRSACLTYIYLNQGFWKGYPDHSSPYPNLIIVWSYSTTLYCKLMQKQYQITTGR